MNQMLKSTLNHRPRVEPGTCIMSGTENNGVSIHFVRAKVHGEHWTLNCLNEPGSPSWQTNRLPPYRELDRLVILRKKASVGE